VLVMEVRSLAAAHLLHTSSSASRGESPTVYYGLSGKSGLPALFLVSSDTLPSFTRSVMALSYYG